MMVIRIENKDKVELIICNNAVIEFTDSPTSFVSVDTRYDELFPKWYSYF